MLLDVGNGETTATAATGLIARSGGNSVARPRSTAKKLGAKRELLDEAATQRMSEDSEESEGPAPSLPELGDPKQVAARVLGHEGRVMAMSKSGYRQQRPSNVCIFNALVVLGGDTSPSAVWWGDLDLTLWEERLCVLARLLARPVFVFHEFALPDSIDDLDLGRATAQVHPTGMLEISADRASYIARGSDGTLRIELPTYTRKRLRLRTLRHRPRLWRFWRIELRRQKAREANERTAVVYVGRRDESRSPLLILSHANRVAAFETLRTLNLTWYPADGGLRRAQRPLIDISPHIRIGRNMLWMRIVVWPAFMWEMLAGFSRQRTD